MRVIYLRAPRRRLARAVQSLLGSQSTGSSFGASTGSDTSGICLRCGTSGIVGRGNRFPTPRSALNRSRRAPSLEARTVRTPRTTCARSVQSPHRFPPPNRATTDRMFRQLLVGPRSHQLTRESPRANRRLLVAGARAALDEPSRGGRRRFPQPSRPNRTSPPQGPLFGGLSGPRRGRVTHGSHSSPDATYLAREAVEKLCP